jgi:peptidoglycan/LPS O-acetylase OafA/YrhL
MTTFIASLGLLHTKSLLDTGMSFPEIAPLIFGGPNLLALLYAFFNEFAGLLLASLSLKAFYSSRLSFLGKRWMVGKVDVAKYSYAAFMVHGPVVLDLQCLFGKKGWESMGAVASALLVGVLSVVESWVGGLMLKDGIEWVGWRGYL